MDNPTEVPTSSLFGKINSANCNLDDIAMSPPSSELETYLHLKNFGCGESNDKQCSNVGSDFAFEEPQVQPTPNYFGSRRMSSFRSHDSLEQIIKENHPEMLGEFEDINFVTQSLPATPLTTPSGTPHGSPHSRRHGFRSLQPVKEVLSLLPWFYPTILNHNTENIGPNKNIKVNMEEAKKSLLEASGIFTTSRGPCVSGSVCGRTNSSKNQRSPNIITNREMNILAPTSM